MIPNQNAVLAKFDQLRSAPFGDITSGTYIQLGTNQGIPVLQNPVRLIKISNSTDVNIIVSFDPAASDEADVIDRWIIFAGTEDILDVASNRVDPSGRLEQPAQISVWVRAEGADPSSGSVYVGVMYAGNN